MLGLKSVLQPGINIAKFVRGISGTDAAKKAAIGATAVAPLYPGIGLGINMLASDSRKAAGKRSPVGTSSTAANLAASNKLRDDAMARRAAELQRMQESVFSSVDAGFGDFGVGPINPPTIDPALAAKYAAAEFDPQIAALLAASKDATRRADRNKRDVGSLYDQFAASILADAKGINRDYDTAGKNVDKIYDEATATIREGYDQSEAEKAAIRRRLGLDEGAGLEIGQGTRDDRNYFSGRAQQDSAASQTLLDQLQANAVTANTGYSQAAKAAGINAQADIARQLTDLLAQHDIQKMTLEGQKAARQSDLSMQFEQTNYSRGMDAWNMTRQANQDQMQLMQMQQEAIKASQPDFGEQWKYMSPQEKFEYKAQELTNGDMALAGEYLDFIRNVVDNDDDIRLGKITPQEFSRRVRAANRDGTYNSAKLNALALLAAEELYTMNAR